MASTACLPEHPVALRESLECNARTAQGCKKYLPCEQREEASILTPEQIFFAWESLRTH
jgi:hypothetical protein